MEEFLLVSNLNFQDVACYCCLCCTLWHKELVSIIFVNALEVIVGCSWVPLTLFAGLNMPRSLYLSVQAMCCWPLSQKPLQFPPHPPDLGCPDLGTELLVQPL